MADPEDPRNKFNRIIRSEEETLNEPPADAVTPPNGTPAVRRPVIDKNDMPLPRRVDEIDVHGTRVTSAAYERTPPPAPTPRRPGSTRPSVAQPRRDFPPPNRPAGASITLPAGGGGCILRGLIISAFFVVALAPVLAAVGVFEYSSIAATLPSVSDLQARASQFETTRILDRNGDVLYEIIDPQAGRRTYISLNEISPYVVAATVSIE